MKKRFKCSLFLLCVISINSIAQTYQISKQELGTTMARCAGNHAAFIVLGLSAGFVDLKKDQAAFDALKNEGKNWQRLAEFFIGSKNTDDLMASTMNQFSALMKNRSADDQVDALISKVPNNIIWCRNYQKSNDAIMACYISPQTAAQRGIRCN